MKPQQPRFRGRQHTARTLALQILLDCRQSEVGAARLAAPGQVGRIGNPSSRVGRIANPSYLGSPDLPKKTFIQEILDRQLAEHPLPPADRRLATQLVYGVLRRRGTLQALLNPVLTRKGHEVEPWLWDALGLGAFQLALLSHIPAHAALNETVELAAQFGRPSAKGFLNGVLRTLAGLLTSERTTTPAADALPILQGEYRRLSRPILPDPASQVIDYLAAGFSLPRWLVRRWLGRFGQDELFRLGFWFAGPAPLTLRCNPLRTGRDHLLAACAGVGLKAERGEHPQAIRLRDAVPIRDIPGYEQGWFTVQDESAMAVGSALAPEPGSRVLDLCAAPGGKTTHLAELMQQQGEIVACDVDEQRLETVNALARRLGLSIIRTHLVKPGDPATLPAGPFDAVLVDVPCSNTGVLGRRPEVRWRLRPEDFQHLVPLQANLLRQAVERVRPGGSVVYSTCSIEPEENAQVVEARLQDRTDLQLAAAHEAIPGRPVDGGYWARLRRHL